MRYLLILALIVAAVSAAMHGFIAISAAFVILAMEVNHGDSGPGHAAT